MKGKNADLINHWAPNLGGSINAAAFLERFVEDGTKWVHLDIAGANEHLSPVAPICPGANGFGTQTFLNYLFKTQH